MLFAALVSLAAAASALASPVHLVSRGLNAALVPQSAPGPACSNLGGGAFDIAYNFTLSAYNSSFALEGEKLTFSPNMYVSGASFQNLATFSSWPYESPSLTLYNGTITVNGGTHGTGTDTLVGTQVGFLFTNLASWPVVPSYSYCGLASTSAEGGGTGQPQLAFNGDADSFSLCGPPQGSKNPYVTVVYKASAGHSSDYDFSSCYPVKLEMVGLLD